MPVDDDATREWLEAIETEYLVQAVHAMKGELLRRGLDECGLEMLTLKANKGLHAVYVSASERERARARALFGDALQTAPVPMRAHHGCDCDHSLPFHEEACPVAGMIKRTAREDQIALDDVNEVLTRVKGHTA